MKVLTVDENVAPFAIEPANGTTAIPVTPRPASGGSGNAEFAEISIPVGTLAANEFANVNGQDLTGKFSTPVQVGDFLWVNALYVSSSPLAFAAAIECTDVDTVAIAVIAFNTGNADPGTMAVRIGRVAVVE